VGGIILDLTHPACCFAGFTALGLARTFSAAITGGESFFATPALWTLMIFMTRHLWNNHHVSDKMRKEKGLITEEEFEIKWIKKTTEQRKKKHFQDAKKKKALGDRQQVSGRLHGVIWDLEISG
jgi:hypothetical protein